ncbi:HalOD1 output domain-containing protein [Halopiger thermotolerans]
MTADYRSDTEAVVPAIVETVAATTDTDPVDIEPLYAAVDPDALNALYRDGFDGEVEFRYAGCTVVVDGEGEVCVAAEPNPGPSLETEDGEPSS